MGNSQDKPTLRKARSVPDTQSLSPEAQVLYREKSRSSQRLYQPNKDKGGGKPSSKWKKPKNQKEAPPPELQLAPSEAAFLPAFPLRGDLEDLDFQVIEVIAKGAYGNVIKVQREDDKRFYATKILSKGQILQEGAVRQCKDEASIQSMAGENPFVVKAHEYWQSLNSLYIVLDYVPHGDMFTLWTFHGAFPEDLVRLYIAEMAMVIDYLHTECVIYRDIKMENILFDAYGHIQLTDFGLAKWLQSGDTTRTVCGTLQYMAPEVLSVYPYSHPADWWSVGILMYTMLAGMYPVDGMETHTKMAQKVFECDYLLPSDISESAQDVINRILTKSPHKRLCALFLLQDLYFFQDLIFSDLTDGKINPVDVVPPDFFPMTGVSWAPRDLSKDNDRRFEQFDDTNANYDKSFVDSYEPQDSRRPTPNHHQQQQQQQPRSQQRHHHHDRPQLQPLSPEGPTSNPYKHLEHPQFASGRGKRGTAPTAHNPENGLKGPDRIGSFKLVERDFSMRRPGRQLSIDSYHQDLHDLETHQSRASYRSLSNYHEDYNSGGRHGSVGQRDERDSRNVINPQRDESDLRNVINPQRGERDPRDVINPQRDERDPRNVINPQRDERDPRNVINPQRDERDPRNVINPQRDGRDPRNVINPQRDERDPRNIINPQRDERDPRNVINPQRDERDPRNVIIPQRDERDSRNINSQRDERDSRNIYSKRDDRDSRNINSQRDERDSRNIISPQRDEKDSRNIISPQRDERDSRSIISPQRDERDSRSIIHPQRDERDSRNVIHPQRDERDSRNVIHPQRDERDSRNVISPHRDERDSRNISPQRDERDSRNVISPQRDERDSRNVISPQRDERDSRNVISPQRDERNVLGQRRDSRDAPNISPNEPTFHPSQIGYSSRPPALPQNPPPATLTSQIISPPHSKQGNVFKMVEPTPTVTLTMKSDNYNKMDNSFTKDGYADSPTGPRVVPPLSATLVTSPTFKFPPSPHQTTGFAQVEHAAIQLPSPVVQIPPTPQPTLQGQSVPPQPPPQSLKPVDFGLSSQFYPSQPYPQSNLPLNMTGQDQPQPPPQSMKPVNSMGLKQSLPPQPPPQSMKPVSTIGQNQPLPPQPPPQFMKPVMSVAPNQFLPPQPPPQSSKPTVTPKPVVAPKPAARKSFNTKKPYQPPSSQAYQPPSSQAYQPPSSQAYQPPSSQAYQPPNSQAYQPPNSQAYQPPNSQAYQPPTSDTLHNVIKPDSIHLNNNTIPLSQAPWDQGFPPASSVNPSTNISSPTSSTPQAQPRPVPRPRQTIRKTGEISSDRSGQDIIPDGQDDTTVDPEDPEGRRNSFHWNLPTTSVPSFI